MADKVRIHELKVVPPYFDSLIAGSKMFEVRRNDRAYQRGDILRFREWHPEHTNSARPCVHSDCGYWSHAFGHWAGRAERFECVITFVYSGDPRLDGIEPGYVVLGLGEVDTDG
jgi:hypothetical protein